MLKINLFSQGSFFNFNNLSKPLLHSLGLKVASQTKERIATIKTAPSGKAWQPHSRKYAAQRSTRELLEKTGRLKGSITYKLMSNKAVEVGTNLVYATTHQYGSKKRNIPQRQFLGLSESNKRELNIIIKNKLI